MTEGEGWMAVDGVAGDVEDVGDRVEWLGVRRPTLVLDLHFIVTVTSRKTGVAR